MSLREEMPTHKEALQQPSTAIQFLQPVRDELSRDVERFLKSGGQINSETKADVVPLRKPLASNQFGTKAEPTPITVMPYKNRTTKKSKHGQNIRARRNNTFWVQVGAIELGRNESWTKEQALAERDKFRKANGLPPAEY
jgi:hypothetical protein